MVLPVATEPKCVPYTIEDRNKYSLRTGYQAFHVTFIADRGYTPFTANRKWPCEIHIMSQIWEFWANYSRRYFYAASGPEVSQLLPYNSVISKILDSADDLMVATAELLLASEHESENNVPAEETEGEATTVTVAQASDTIATPSITAEDVRIWLESNVTRLIDVRAKVPNRIFIAKIADELNVYGISLEKLEEMLQDPTTLERYRRLLQFNGLTFLPVYQQVLCMILLYLDRDIQTVVDRVNSQLWLLGLRLHAPTEGV